jgi:predicted acyltransferase
LRMANTLNHADLSINRIKSVDEFRGFAIISMIIVNYLACYKAIPLYLKHATGVGYFTFADLVAPFFIFIIGLVYRRSFLNRLALYGREKAWFHVIRRYFLFLALGFAGTWIAEGRITFEWGVLQAIGVAGLITLFFIETRFWKRIVIALFMLVLYQRLLFPSLHKAIIQAKHGGIWASFSWAAMLILATVAGDLIDMKKFWTSSKKLALYGSVLFLAGLINLKFVPISKMEVNSSYVLISIGLAAFMFDIFFILMEHFHLTIPFLKILGKNALFIYIAHYLLIHLLYLFIPHNANLMLIIFGSALICTLCYLLACYMDAKKLYLRF